MSPSTKPKAQTPKSKNESPTDLKCRFLWEVIKNNKNKLDVSLEYPLMPSMGTRESMPSSELRVIGITMGVHFHFVRRNGLCQSSSYLPSLSLGHFLSIFLNTLDLSPSILGQALANYTSRSTGVVLPTL